VAASAVAHVATPHAARYLGQMCRHFQHKLPVTLEGDAGTIGFAVGTCRLRAGPERLEMAVAVADRAHLAQLQDVVARHLVRFAFREALDVAWHDLAAA
jgi:hypothetical protein